MLPHHLSKFNISCPPQNILATCPQLINSSLGDWGSQQVCSVLQLSTKTLLPRGNSILWMKSIEKKKKGIFLCGCDLPRSLDQSTYVYVFEKAKQVPPVEKANKMRELLPSWSTLDFGDAGSYRLHDLKVLSIHMSAFHLGARWFIRDRHQQRDSASSPRHHRRATEKQAVRVSNENEWKGDIFRGGAGVRAPDRIWDKESKSAHWRQLPESPRAAEEGKAGTICQLCHFCSQGWGNGSCLCRERLGPQGIPTKRPDTTNLGEGKRTLERSTGRFKHYHWPGSSPEQDSLFRLSFPVQISPHGHKNAVSHPLNSQSFCLWIKTSSQFF